METFSSQPEKQMRAHEGRLADNIVYFARTLRKAGMKVGPAAVNDAIEAVMAAGIGSRDDFYWTLHAVLVTRHEDTVIFDEAFRLYWRSRELEIVSRKAPQANKRLSEEIVRYVQKLREMELFKVPGVAETLDWAAALVGLEVRDLAAEPEVVQDTLLCLLKTQEDRLALAPEVTQRLLGKVA